MNPVRRAAATALAATVSVAPLAGCESTVAGEAMKASTPASAVSVALLDTGPFPTRAGAPFGNAGSAAGGAQLEGIRMAQFVAGPWEVDATLTQFVFNGMPIADAQGLKNDLGEAAGDVAAAHGFIAGFATGRSLQGPGLGKSLVNLVLRFPNPDSAAAAARGMAAELLRGAVPPHHPSAVPRHPEALASSFTDDNLGTVVESYTAHGPYVFYELASTKDRPEIAGELTANMLDIQAPRIDGFAPTDPAQLANLPVDPSGLLARTLPPPPGQDPVPAAGVYQQLAELHFETNPAESAQLFTAAGIEIVTRRWRSRVYQAHDGTGAGRLVDRFVHDTNTKAIAGVNGLPGSQCFDQGDQLGAARFVCVVVVDRYAYMALSGSETEAKQETAAQYRILAGK